MTETREFAEPKLTGPFALFRGLLPPPAARRLAGEAMNLPARRVTCHDSPITWWEYSVPEGHAVRAIFDPAAVAAAARALLSSPIRPLAPMSCWVSLYRAGECIGPHRDAAGDLQIVACLEAPGAGAGGELCLRGEGDTLHQVRLEPGDAIAFVATRVEHFTTPLVATPADPEPRRVVAVSRYAFAAGP